MSKFFVGQRVRVARSEDSATDRFVGMEAIVTEVDNRGWNEGGALYGLNIYPIQYDPSDDSWTGFDAGELEPLLPSGHRASEYSLTELLDRCRAGEGIAA